MKVFESEVLNFQKFEPKKDEITADAYNEYMDMKQSLDFVTVPVKFIESIKKENSLLKRKISSLKLRLLKKGQIININEDVDIPDDNYITITDFNNKYNSKIHRSSFSQDFKANKLSGYKDGKFLYIHEKSAYMHYVKGIRWKKV